MVMLGGGGLVGGDFVWWFILIHVLECPGSVSEFPRTSSGMYWNMLRDVLECVSQCPGMFSRMFQNVFRNVQ